MLINKSCIYLVVFMFSIQFFAQEIVTDRPDQTESSVTVGANALQIESGISYATYGNFKSFNGPSTLFRLGIIEPIELRLLVQYEVTKLNLQNGSINYRGFNDIEIGAKVQLLKKKDLATEVAFLSHIVFPTAKNALSNNNVGVINKLSISHEISEKLSLGYNIGYDYLGNQSSFTYSVALGFSITNNFAFYLEPYGSWAEQHEVESNFDFGVTYLINPTLQLDASYGFGLNNDLNYFSTGISWKIPTVLTNK